MFSHDVRFEGFTATDWERCLSLFRPRSAAGEQRDPARPQGGIVAVHARGRLRKLLHTRVGRIEVRGEAWPQGAAELSARHEASWSIVLESGALEETMERFGARARPTDDLLEQAISLAQALREMMIEGRVDLWPRRLRGVPIPTPGMVRRTLDAVCPSGRAMVLGLFEGGELWTCLALRRRAGVIDRVVGPYELRAEMGLLAGDWRRDYRHLVRAVEERIGPLALGCFAEASTFRRLEVDPTPGAWARAVAVRDVILSPVPVGMALPLGVDAARAAMSAARDVAERVDPLGVVAPALRALREQGLVRLERSSLLGFAPLELLRRLLAR